MTHATDNNSFINHLVSVSLHIKNSYSVSQLYTVKMIMLYLINRLIKDDVKD